MKKKQNASSGGVRVKKVTAYPFPVLMTLGGPQPMQGQVLKVTLEGALIDVGVNFVKTGVNGIVDFRLPTFQRPLHLQVKVMKSYDRATGVKAVFSAETPAAQASAAPAPKAEDSSPSPVTATTPLVPGKVKIVRLIEVRFLLLSDADRSEIVQFINLIKQA